MGLIERLRRDERGGPLAEFALVVGLIFVTAFTMFEVTRFFMQLAMAEYATQLSARRAVVRLPACPGVATINDRGANTAPRFGTLCSAAAGVCATPATVTCAGAAGNATVDEIFGVVGPLLPNGATPANLEFRYEPSGLGFLGGPYIPIVSVSLQNLDHDFILPLGAGFAPWGGGDGGLQSVRLPPLTATMPGEDLNIGTGG